jgi:hypothetical protein
VTEVAGGILTSIQVTQEGVLMSIQEAQVSKQAACNTDVMQEEAIIQLKEV